MTATTVVTERISFLRGSVIQKQHRDRLRLNRDHIFLDVNLPPTLSHIRITHSPKLSKFLNDPLTLWGWDGREAVHLICKLRTKHLRMLPLSRWIFNSFLKSVSSTTLFVLCLTGKLQWRKLISRRCFLYWGYSSSATPRILQWRVI